MSIQERERAMAGNNRQKKLSFFSIFNIFKACFSPGGDDTGDEASTHEGSEENRRGWVGDCGIDKRVSDYIVKFHATKVSDTQTHAV